MPVFFLGMVLFWMLGTQVVAAPDMRSEQTTTLLASFTTQYDHFIVSRDTNLALAASKINGMVLSPGQEFSFNGQVGPRTKEKGFQLGRVFVGNRMVDDYGGGVCQVASTLYNAVLLANLQVTARRQHSMTVPYVPPGRDATVDYQSGLDFRFRNNTAGPITILATTWGPEVTFSIYGTEKPPTVYIRHKIINTYPYTTMVRQDAHLHVKRRIVQYGQLGYAVRTWVEIHQNGKVQSRVLSTDHYQPSPERVLIQ